jgi:hypothetical protein
MDLKLRLRLDHNSSASVVCLSIKGVVIFLS